MQSCLLHFVDRTLSFWRHINTAVQLAYDPSYIGKSVHFTFKFDGARWIIMGTIPQMKGDKKIGEEQLEEVWKRSE